MNGVTHAATDFFVLVAGNSSAVHCDYLTINNGEVSCKENRTLLVYSFEEVSQVTVINNGKKFVFDKEIKENRKELAEAINLLNTRKIEKAQQEEIARQRKIAEKKEKERRRRERAEQYRLEFGICRDLYYPQCVEECAVNKYQSNRSCVNTCIEIHCL